MSSRTALVSFWRYVHVRRVVRLSVPSELAAAACSTLACCFAVAEPAREAYVVVAISLASGLQRSVDYRRTRYCVLVGVLSL